MSEMTDDAKWCKGCGEIKPLAEFYRRGDGSLFSRCKPCEKAKSVSWLRNRREWLRSGEEEARDQGVPLDSKECYVCREVRPISEYRTNRPDGRLSLTCAGCRLKGASHAKDRRSADLSGARNRMREFKRRRMMQWKEGKACGECGESHPACLDFHHRDPQGKEFNICNAIAIGLSDKEIAAEVAKCDILCANCHRKRHWIIGDSPK